MPSQHRGQPREGRHGGGHQGQAGRDSLHSAGAPASTGVRTPEHSHSVEDKAPFSAPSPSQAARRTERGRTSSYRWALTDVYKLTRQLSNLIEVALARHDHLNDYWKTSPDWDMDSLTIDHELRQFL